MIEIVYHDLSHVARVGGLFKSKSRLTLNRVEKWKQVMLHKWMSETVDGSWDCQGKTPHNPAIPTVAGSMSLKFRIGSPDKLKP